MNIQGIPFTKMHGLGNDFIIFDTFISDSRKVTDAHLSLISQKDLIKKIADRHFGVGADQIFILTHSNKADLKMQILNSDGSEAEMCGNGIRTVALYAKTYGLFKKKMLEVETLGGVKKVVEETIGEFTVDMGVPVLTKTEGQTLQIKKQDGSVKHVLFFEANMGNPHAVTYVESTEQTPLEFFGRQIETHLHFPNKTNVEFVEVLSRNHLKVRVWERGAGETLACGSGACAVAAVAIATRKATSPLEVELPGGVLKLKWEGNAKPILMTGPAQESFFGYLPLV